MRPPPSRVANLPPRAPSRFSRRFGSRLLLAPFPAPIAWRRIGRPAIFLRLMSAPNTPLARLDRQEMLWLAGILKDACRERLEKNLVNQAFEEKLYKRGPVAGRLDPRPFLKIWEPRYRKFLDIATELHAELEAGDARSTARHLQARVKPLAAVERQGPLSSAVMNGKSAVASRRRSRSR